MSRKNTFNGLIQMVFSLFVLIYLQACNSPIATKAHALTVEQKITGYYTYGHEVNSVQPCKQKKVYAVTGSEEILQLLQQNYVKYTSQPYDEVYIEIIGSFLGKVSDGFEMDYDGQILVIKMLNMKKKSESDCN